MIVSLPMVMCFSFFRDLVIVYNSIAMQEFASGFSQEKRGGRESRAGQRQAMRVPMEMATQKHSQRKSLVVGSVRMSACWRSLVAGLLGLGVT